MADVINEADGKEENPAQSVGKKLVESSIDVGGDPLTLIAKAMQEQNRTMHSMASAMEHMAYRGLVHNRTSKDHHGDGHDGIQHRVNLRGVTVDSTVPDSIRGIISKQKEISPEETREFEKDAERIDHILSAFTSNFGKSFEVAVGKSFKKLTSLGLQDENGKVKTVESTRGFIGAMRRGIVDPDSDLKDETTKREKLGRFIGKLSGAMNMDVDARRAYAKSTFQADAELERTMHHDPKQREVHLPWEKRQLESLEKDVDAGKVQLNGKTREEFLKEAGEQLPKYNNLKALERNPRVLLPEYKKELEASLSGEALLTDEKTPQKSAESSVEKEEREKTEKFMARIFPTSDDKPDDIQPGVKDFIEFAKSEKGPKDSHLSDPFKVEGNSSTTLQFPSTIDILHIKTVELGQVTIKSLNINDMIGGDKKEQSEGSSGPSMISSAMSAGKSALGKAATSGRALMSVAGKGLSRTLPFLAPLAVGGGLIHMANESGRIDAENIGIDPSSRADYYQAKDLNEGHGKMADAGQKLIQKKLDAGEITQEQADKLSRGNTAFAQPKNVDNLRATNGEDVRTEQANTKITSEAKNVDDLRIPTSEQITSADSIVPVSNQNQSGLAAARAENESLQAQEVASGGDTNVVINSSTNVASKGGNGGGGASASLRPQFNAFERFVDRVFTL